MHRITFCKTGTAKFISHLDLMRTFQRAFLRAAIPIKHTEGFNPHAFVSLPLPLSVGFSSECEVLECTVLEGALEDIPARLNAVLPTGIIIKECYEGVSPVKALTYVNYIVTLHYESGAPFGAERAIQNLLAQDSWVVTKKSKKAKSGQVEVDLIPLIAKSTIEERRDSITLDLRLRAQNPGLNPELLVRSIVAACPGITPDFIIYHRRAVLNGQGEYWL